MRLVELHPVLELALRRQAQSWVPYAVRGGLAAATGALFLAVVGSQGLAEGEQLHALALSLREKGSLVLCLYVLFVVPAMTVGPYVRARETGMLEALVMSGVPEWQIVRAFWWSSMAGTVLCLAGAIPFFTIVTGLPGVSGADVGLILFGATCGAGLLAAIVLAFGASSSASGSVGQAALTFGFGASLLALIVGIFLRLVLPALLPSRPGVVAEEFVAFGVGIAALVAMSMTLSHAGRRLARTVSSDEGRTPYSLAIALNPEAFRFRSTIDDAPGHLMRRLSRAPRIAGILGTVAAALVVLSGGERERLALLVLAASAVVAGAWSATSASELFASPEKASDLSLAGHDPAALRRRVIEGAAAASSWPVASSVLLALSGLLRGWLEVRQAILMAGLAFAGWLLAAGGGTHLVLRRRSGTAALALILAASLGGAVWVDVLASREGSLAMAHPLALLAALARDGFVSGTQGGPPVLAAFLWVVVSLCVDARTADRWRRLYREPAA